MIHRWQRFVGLVVCCAGLALFHGSAAGQAERAADQPPEGQVGGLRFIDTSEVTVVNVDVTVRDKQGPVLDLGRDDFLVYQDGRLQELSNFILYRSDETAPPAAATPAAEAAVTESPAAAPEPVESPREPRFIAIYVDNENIMPFNRNRVLTKLQDFLREHLHPPDQAMLLSYQRSLKVLQGFTSDPEELISALRQVRMYTGGLVEVSSTRNDIEEEIYNDAEGRRDVNRILGRIRGFAQEQRNSLVFAVRTVQEAVTMMSGLPGKKAIIHVSDGLPMSPGLELYYEAEDRYRSPGMITMSREFDSTDLYRALVNSAAAAGVTIYTIEARGLESDLGIEADRRQSRSTISAAIGRSNLQDSLLYMAEQTGGLAVINANDVGPHLERIADDFATYYSLGYRLVPTGDDRVHHIKVEVKDHPDYRLSYRPTFIEKSLPSRTADRVVSGLTVDINHNPLDITLSSGEPSPATGGRWLLPIEIKIPVEKIALIPDGEKLVGYLMAYYAARDDEGKQSDLQRTEHLINVPAGDYDSTKSQHFTITASLLLEPGSYKLSVGVRDELTNQAGFAVARRVLSSKGR